MELMRASLRAKALTWRNHSPPSPATYRKKTVAENTRKVTFKVTALLAHTAESEKPPPAGEVNDGPPETKRVDSGKEKTQEDGSRATQNTNIKGTIISLPAIHNIRSAPGLAPPEADNLNTLHVAFAGRLKTQQSTREEGVRTRGGLRGLHEKRGGKRNLSRSVMDFQACVSAAGIEDAGFTGSKFTWSNGRTTMSGEAGGGGILSDHNGDMHCAFATPYYDLKNSLAAEALALRDGLRMCCRMGASEVQVETDSLNLVHIVTKQIPRLWDLSFILHEIVVIAAKVKAEITHIPREGNRVVDCLADFAFSCACFTLLDRWADLPCNVMDSCRHDKAGRVSVDLPDEISVSVKEKIGLSTLRRSHYVLKDKANSLWRKDFVPNCSHDRFLDEVQSSSFIPQVQPPESRREEVRIEAAVEEAVQDVAAGVSLKHDLPEETINQVLRDLKGEIACKTMYQNKSKKIKKSTKDKYLSTAPKMPVDSPAQTDLIGYWQGVPVDSPIDACRQICSDRTHRLLARCACRQTQIAYR
ncbi:hypothetical protein Taro_027175 [Colocasia esculenta]|uniref:RNase H type-1 domain-containing protein n=1 Tax=Colocasia esculenta TaxID=4460 RepID=A0A843VF02_COLES|nr:hypothetical protein [Colocasia esculenta]